MAKLERHHCLWTKSEWSKKPISNQVRQMGAFLIDVHHENHRLLHASLEPPELPDHDTLYLMRDLALGGLTNVIKKLRHPIVEHIDDQLKIIELDKDEAEYILDNGLYKPL